MHPATRLGRGLLLDHGTGIVIGETAVVGDDCSFLQGVTLGGTGKESGDRHPKVRRLTLAAAARGHNSPSHNELTLAPNNNTHAGGLRRSNRS